MCVLPSHPHTMPFPTTMLISMWERESSEWELERATPLLSTIDFEYIFLYMDEEKNYIPLERFVFSSSSYSTSPPHCTTLLSFAVVVARALYVLSILTSKLRKCQLVCCLMETVFDSIEESLLYAEKKYREKNVLMDCYDIIFISGWHLKAGFFDEMNAYYYWIILT